MSNSNTKLEEIGFYTLSDKRAENSSHTSSLERCELILTESCNLKCPYCRPINAKTLTYDEAVAIVDKWAEHGLKNIRFSGGEPTLVPYLVPLVRHTASIESIENIAISTNGTADEEVYRDLLDAGVYDFSISLDACCSSGCQKMAGITNEELYSKICNNIKFLTQSELAYVTVGIVVTEENVAYLDLICALAHNLGVDDIRIIPSAQWDQAISPRISKGILNQHPILNYRVTNIKNGRHCRGIKDGDSEFCRLCLDDMAVKNNEHYPCIIYMREGGDPIGSMDKSIEDIRKARNHWYLYHNTANDRICRANCLDVCVDFNNKAKVAHAQLAIQNV